MLVRNDERLLGNLVRRRALVLAVTGLLLACAPGASGQTQADSSTQVGATTQGRAPSLPVTPLKDLLAEAERNNPQVDAARQAWEAAKQVPSQVSTLPDPEFVIQQTNVGSPRPFAGYTNSEFAYIGLGVSQDLPYPGKLKLRGELAKQDANVSQQQLESVRRSVLGEVKSVYFQVAYLSTMLGIINSDGELLKQVEQAADARYRAGLGRQQDLLQAQLQRTKLIRDFAVHDLEVSKAQAQLKQLLGRPQSSPDINPSALASSTLSLTFADLLAAADVENPHVSGAERMVDKQKLQVDLAHKDFYPDFNLQYMWNRTDPTQFRAYYTLTFGVRVPIYRARKQRPELAEAEADLKRVRREAESQLQQVDLEVRNQFDTEQETARVARIYQDGLLPQTRAEFQSALAAYQNDRQDFQALLTSFLDVLQMDEEYWQDVADHETAMARLEELTGLSLREGGGTQ